MPNNTAEHRAYHMLQLQLLVAAGQSVYCYNSQTWENKITKPIVSWFGDAGELCSVQGDAWTASSDCSGSTWIVWDKKQIAFGCELPRASHQTPRYCCGPSRRIIDFHESCLAALKPALHVKKQRFHHSSQTPRASFKRRDMLGHKRPQSRFKVLLLQGTCREEVGG